MRIGIDVGGTFTDAVAVDERGRMIAHHKEPSTPPRVEEGAVAALHALAQGDAVMEVVHGTTVATNALIERAHGPVGLITTRGFRDVLAIGTMQRPDLYDVMQTKPVPIAPRELRLEVPERTAADGSVLEPLDEGAVERCARRLARKGVRAVAICFLFAQVNPDHERRAGAIVRRMLPTAEVALSSEVAPMLREFPRTSTTLINAALRPIVSRYLRDLEARSDTRVLVMQSNGGVLPAREAAARAHQLLVSGPAGGIVGATMFAEAFGARDLVTIDMGGTSFDTCLVLDGRPSVRGESHVAGWPVLSSSVDLVTVGAGGGSIATVDAGGALRVGPTSAGAVPGPACYGGGGAMPTLTDANLLVGLLDPERFLGGRLLLDVEAAERAMFDHVARPLGVSVERASYAIVSVASTNAARALRVVTVGRGRDPATLPLVAFGGAGPLHALRLADELGASQVLVPPIPAFVSAIGLLASELRTEVAQTILRPGRSAAAPGSIAAAVERMSGSAARRLGIGDRRATSSIAVDCRYRGQGYELTVPLDAPNADGLDRARRRFHEVHDALYGHAAPNEPVEIVALRVTATAPTPEIRPEPIAPRGEPSPTEVRKVFDGDGWSEVPVFDRETLPPRWRAPGPLVVAEGESTTWVPPGWSVGVDPIGTLEATRG